MTIYAEWADDLDAMIADKPSVLLWGEQTVACTASPIMRSKDVDPSGELNLADVECAAKVTDFTGSVLPTAHTVVTLDGVKYHVVSTESDGVGVRIPMRRV